MVLFTVAITASVPTGDSYFLAIYLTTIRKISAVVGSNDAQLLTSDFTLLYS